MAEGVGGLTRDKTRTPGKRPLSPDTVQRVVDVAPGPPPGEEKPTDRSDAGESGGSEPAIGATYPRLMSTRVNKVQNDHASDNPSPGIRLFRSYSGIPVAMTSTTRSRCASRIVA
jgi:hypothetical protein